MFRASSFSNSFLAISWSVDNNTFKKHNTIHRTGIMMKKMKQTMIPIVSCGWWGKQAVRNILHPSHFVLNAVLQKTSSFKERWRRIRWWANRNTSSRSSLKWQLRRMQKHSWTRDFWPYNQQLQWICKISRTKFNLVKGTNSSPSECDEWTS